ncbi:MULTISPECIES: recombinase-like helix-turn-helix domain-containing protein [Novosphingobium]|uniref:recombinase-like helix-turn-helix domain-containing protein n=1 Tax=Novosphingobium TaxID=165696 RepID=UPI0022F25828|nr:recombinase-like helix-turn-helix domain-containing protein [Novosphingobium resinovorum]GLK46005.1 hypothetical protein GCM10017612_39250 [Novosphingobium resinovorum]
MRYNLYLAETGDAKGGGRFIEEPDQVDNFVFQTRGGPLDPFEQALSQALTAAFDAGAFEFPELVAALNAGGSRAPDGAAWTEPTLDAELDRLGQALFQPVSGDIAA